MTALLTPSLLLVFLLLNASSSSALKTETETETETEKMCGIALSTGHDLAGYRHSKTDRTIQQIKHDGGNYVQISAYTKQIGLDSTKQIRETDDASLEYIIRKLHQKGLKVFLKPTVSVVSEKGAYRWRGHIKGSKKWFRELYRPYMLRMARLAKREKVEVLSMGSEFRDAVGKTWEWVRVINAVRKVYKGKLTYIANHDAYTRVKFFKHLDFISISAYYKMLSGKRGPSPTHKRTKEMFAARLRRLEKWRRQSNLEDKDVLIAEVGYQSKGNGVVYRLPWDWDVKAPTNYWEQAKMYDSFFSTFLKPDWILGVMMWHYELDNSVGRSFPSSQWYTPQNKPAQGILRKYFRSFCG